MATVLVLVLREKDGGPEPVPSSAPNPPNAGGAPLAVKIDNVAPARPQTGLGAADVLYVEPVEGGLTRLLALYGSTVPPVVGPVRSARRTDIDVLAQFGRPTFAYSGAAPQLLPALHGASLDNASPTEVAGAYTRDSRRQMPHNLLLQTGRLPGTRSPSEVFERGAAPAGGVSANGHNVDFPAAKYAFTWSPGARRWLVSLDRSPVVSTDSGPLAMPTVIVQQVRIDATEPIEDAHGTVSPVAITVGQGTATVLRDGQRFAGTWSRPDPGSPTRFRTAAGAPLPVADGPVMVLLVPA
ncbi:DUF3048 family protein [Herbihabitans rhizosphaerae]|uniref:DUF3048 family protein n=1 Tax=Herbihabitans rhizosphaerae TaxID=1872711 RepID=A0A4Q7L424_9PSEU|nr:DUF3048 family protein [Herbihabitans rhizosphaerae]